MNLEVWKSAVQELIGGRKEIQLDDRAGGMTPIESDMVFVCLIVDEMHSRCPP